MTDNPLHIVFAGGGTGGHLFPGLAVAEQLVGEVPQARVTFVGGGKRFERRHVAAAGFEYLHRGHYKPGRAEAALHGGLVYERLLNVR